MDEFHRLRLLIGDKLNNLQNTTVALFGLGGVGSYSAEILARSGIGNLIIIDNDTINITNLNRQLMTNHNNIGKYKTDEIELRLKSINPNINIIKINEFISKENINLVFDKNPDYVIDAIDTLETKKEIIRICKKKNIKFITCMGTGNKLHPEKLKIVDIRKTSYDPIAKIIRKMVKDEKIKGKVMVVCSDEVKVTQIKDEIPSCAFVPSTAGILCASYVINDIVGDNNV